MPTEKPRIILTVDDNLLKRNDDFRFGNRINTRSEAIRRLIDESLKSTKKKENHCPATPSAFPSINHLANLKLHLHPEKMGYA